MFLRATRTSYSHVISLCSFGIILACAPALARAQQPAPFYPAAGEAPIAAPHATAFVPPQAAIQPATGEAPFATLSTQQPSATVSQTSANLQGTNCVQPSCAPTPSCVPAPIVTQQTCAAPPTSCCSGGGCGCNSSRSGCCNGGGCSLCEEGCWNPCGWYASISGGWTQRERVHEVGTPQTFLTWEDGFSINGAVGYEFSIARAEFEVGLTNTDVDQAGARVPNVGDFTSSARGNVSLRKYMFNLYHDFKFGDFALKPYVGAGVGFYQSEINGLFPEFFTGLGLGDSGVNATSDFPFAYQLKAGASYETSERTELFVGYTFFDGNALDFAAAPFGPFEPNSATTHSVEIGLRFKL